MPGGKRLLSGGNLCSRGHNSRTRVEGLLGWGRRSEIHVKICREECWLLPRGARLLPGFKVERGFRVCNAPRVLGVFDGTFSAAIG